MCVGITHLITDLIILEDFMNRTIAIFSFFLGCLCATQCFAGEVYIGVLGGGTGRLDLKKAKADADLGYYVGGQLGYQFFGRLRLEEELSYQEAKIHSFETKGMTFHHAKGHVNLWSLMTNLIVDLDFPFIISPYMGGGLGYLYADGHWSGHIKDFRLHENQFSKQELKKNGLAWQAIVGLKYFVCLSLELGLEYRYFKFENELATHKVGLVLKKFF